MAHRRSFRGRGISESQRRKKSWVQTAKLVGSGSGAPGFSTSLSVALTTPATIGDSTLVVDALLAGDGTGTNPLFSVLPEEATILRIRGSLLFPKNQTDGLGTVSQQFVFGLGVKSIVGTTSDSYPGPISDASWDGWMYLRQSALPPVDANATIIDVKSMRKLKSGDHFFVAVEGLTGTGGTGVTVEWVYDLRLLLLLP